MSISKYSNSNTRTEIISFPVKILNNDIKTSNIDIELKVQKKNNNFLVHRAFIYELVKRRNYTASTKTRSEVSGGGRKPWKQKGTGRARAGSIRSPLWRGGGVTFGPKPKKTSIKLNRKEWQLALRNTLVSRRDNICVLDGSELSSILKTKDFINKLKNIGISLTNNKKILVIYEERNLSLCSSIKNIPNINFTVANNLSVTALLNAQTIITTTNALKIIEKTYGK